MRRVETVRNNSRGRFVEKLILTTPLTPCAGTMSGDTGEIAIVNSGCGGARRGHKIKHTKRVFLPIFFYPSGHPLAAADPLDALAEAWLTPLA